MWPPYKLHGWGSHNVSCWMVLCWHWGSFLNAKSFCKTQVLYRCWWFCPLTQITLADLHSIKFKFEMLFFKTLTIFTSIKWTSLMESSETLWTHLGFFKQRMQSHNFQYFNVTSQRGKKKKNRNPILCVWTDCCSVEVSQFLFSTSPGDRWLVRVVTGRETRRTCHQAKRVCGCVCLSVVCSVGFCHGGGLLMDLPGAPESSVQSQQGLGVLTLPLVFVFQRAGFHHRLRPVCRKTHMIAMAAADALTSLGSPCFFLWSLL